MRATGFFDKMGFKCVPEGGLKRERLLSVIHHCTSSQLMMYERGDDQKTVRDLQRSVYDEINIIEKMIKDVEGLVEDIGVRTTRN